MPTKASKPPFDAFLAQLRETCATLDYFCDFPKIRAKVEEVAIELHQLNYLVGKENLSRAVKALWKKNPDAFRSLGILVAVRDAEHQKVFRAQDGSARPLETWFRSLEGIMEYLEETGLAKVLRNKDVTNLVDYVFGVETGLDTNTRKNRSGHLMEELVASDLQAGGVSFRQEVKSSELPGLDVLGEDLKRFDFVIETPRRTYLVEVNFYGSGGSKPNEIARSYTELDKKIRALPRYEFVWVTDGAGWRSAHGSLEAAYGAIPNLYNLATLGDFIKRVKRSQAGK